MDKFVFLKSKINSIFSNSIFYFEEKLNNDINKIEELKYLFYNIDKSGKILDQNSE